MLAILAKYDRNLAVFTLELPNVDFKMNVRSITDTTKDDFIEELYKNADNPSIAAILPSIRPSRLFIKIVR